MYDLFSNQKVGSSQPTPVPQTLVCSLFIHSTVPAQTLIAIVGLEPASLIGRPIFMEDGHLYLQSCLQLCCAHGIEFIIIRKFFPNCAVLK